VVILERELRSNSHDAGIVGAHHKSEESARVHKLTRHGILDELRGTQEAELKMWPARTGAAYM
jgi:hypothetical protein